jgi:uncharacterized membrane protein
VEIVVLIIVFFLLAAANAAPGVWALYLGFAFVAVRSFLERKKKDDAARRLSALERSQLSDRLSELEQKVNHQLSSLTARVYALEQEGRAAPPRKTEAPEEVKPILVEPPAAARVRAPEPVQPLVKPAAPPPAPPQASPAAPPAPKPSPPEIPPKPPEPPPPPSRPTLVPPEAAKPAPGAPPLQPWQGAPLAKPSPPPKVTPPPPPAPSLAEPPRRAFDLEEKLGANWLGKLGVILVVLGIALYIAYLWDKIPAIGKVSSAT